MTDVPRSSYYIRHEDGRIEACDDFVRWGRWFQDAGNSIEFTNVTDDVQVSTCFLGIDHNFGFLDGPRARLPILFETMTFYRLAEPLLVLDQKLHRNPGCQWRWHTEAEARRAHGFIVARLREDPTADLSDYEPLSRELEVDRLAVMVEDLKGRLP